MTIGPVLLKLLEEVRDDQYTDEVKATLRTQIESATVDLTLNPRDKTEGNLRLLNAAMLVIMGVAQDLYGVGDDTGLHQFPIFIDQPQSQVVPLLNEHRTVAIGLGLCVRSWEEVFYDICHESLHLLNPVVNAESGEVNICTLEEGVAVKFAEQMYRAYIRGYFDMTPLTSPINTPNSPYFKAYAATQKIPDDVLKEIRISFGKFSIINSDPNKFTEMTEEYLSEEEIQTLLSKFIYPTRPHKHR